MPPRKSRRKRRLLRSRILRDFFASGLAGKSHAHTPERAYDRRKLKRQLRRLLREFRSGAAEQ